MTSLQAVAAIGCEHCYVDVVGGMRETDAAESTTSLLDEVEVQIMGSPRVNEAIAKLLRAAMSKNTLFFSVAEDKRLQCIQSLLDFCVCV